MLLFLGALFQASLLRAVDPDSIAQLRYYQKEIRPIIRKHCGSCHNEGDKKAGLNILNYDFVVQIVRRGELWSNILKQVETEQMPPSNKPRLSKEEKQIFVEGIREILSQALAEPDPGQVILRRLSHSEYKYAVKDLLGLELEVQGYFPADASGGGGFDNQSRTLYMTPLLFERYYEVARVLVDSLSSNPQLWKHIVPNSYRPGLFTWMGIKWQRIWTPHQPIEEKALNYAEEILYPLATRAFRKFLSPEEKGRIRAYFEKVYAQMWGESRAFEKAIKESLVKMLIAPEFLYRREGEALVEGPYPISNFELATRLSFLLWNSIPDDSLLAHAYRAELHKPEVLRKELRRMIRDPKAQRFSQSFSTQWLELNKLGTEHEVDPDRFPGYSGILERAMKAELANFFHHVLTESQNFLDLLDSDYTFVNETLAEHYGIPNIEGPEFRKVIHKDSVRGGVLGMAGVLTTTSLATRTSPVIRGKWVLEQLLGTPPPPPPPDVPELEAAKKADGELDLRALLSLHRAPSTCHSCHQKMDPIGLGLENFDAIGRWRTRYEEVPIDPSGVLVSGEKFQGPAQLRKILITKREEFAENLSRKMLSYALGRGVRFKDYPTIEKLKTVLLEENFDTTRFLEELVMSFPFRYKKSDLKTHLS